MSIADALNNSGFKKEKSTEGMFEPYEGTYKAVFSECEEVKSQKDGAQQLRVGFKIEETLDGRESTAKFPEFKKWLALEGDGSSDKKKGVAFIINTLFTSGYEVNTSGDDASIIESIKAGLGTPVYVKAWGWQPEGGDKKYQQFSVLQEAVALKNVKKSSSPF